MIQIEPKLKTWTEGIEIEASALQQLKNAASLPIVWPHVAAMPDVHFGIGATVGSVIPTRGAIVPAAVGVDIGCGMVATRLKLTAHDLPDSLKSMRTAIEEAVPVGFATNKWAGHLKGGHAPGRGGPEFPATLQAGLARLREKHPKVFEHGQPVEAQLGSLGGGNHFIEVCLDEEDQVWLMLHSGSRGVGNRIGTHFIALAREDMGDALGTLPDRDLAYFTEGAEHFQDYVEAVGWAQAYASANRLAMVHLVLKAVAKSLGRDGLASEGMAVNCHHNYVQQERHYGEQVWLTRKGAVNASAGVLGIIPGSMGTKSYIVEGLGNPESFESCSHGAGRRMSRGAAKRAISLADHAVATAGVECRKDEGVLDESPAAYKDLDVVMAAQADLVKIRHTLKAVVCVKG